MTNQNTRNQNPSRPFDPNHLREALTYLNRYQNALFLLKIEDSLIDHPLFPLLLKDIVYLHRVGIRVVIVPGIRKTIAKYLQQWEVETAFEDGVRITSDEAFPLIRLAAMDVTQKFISQLAANGAIGIMGNWVKARSLGVVDGIDYGRTGRVTRIQVDVIKQILDQDYIPLVPNLGWNDVGRAYNLNSNEVALQLGTELNISKLFFIGEETGLQAKGLILPAGVNPGHDGIIASLDRNKAKELLELNQNNLDYHSKDYLEKSIAACTHGVQRVHLVSGLSEGSILQEVFSSRGQGTMVYANRYFHLRKPIYSDVPELLRFMQDFIDQQLLVARTEEQITDRLDDFCVVEADHLILGIGALHVHKDGIGEIAAIAVNRGHQAGGVGHGIMEFQIERARNLGLHRLYLLTTQAMDWFAKLGFKTGHLEDLPKEAQDRYNTRRNSKIMIMNLQES